MKNLHFYFFKKILFLLTVLCLFLSSCSGDNDEGSGVLAIESVSLTGYSRSLDNVYTPIDSLTTTGFSGNLYVIRGSGFLKTRKIYFNDFDTYFNPTMVTDNNIIVQIPVGVPYSNSETSNKLKIVATDGTEVLYDFNIGQPRPNIVTYPLAGLAGTTATITGTDFVNVVSVKIGTIEATVQSSTETEIVITIPEGITGAQKIFVETLGGVSESLLHFGFNYALFDESRNSDWWEGGWGGPQTFDETTFVRDGSFSIKKVYGGGFNGFQIGNGGSTFNINDYTVLKISLNATMAGKVKIVIGANFDLNAYVIDLIPGKWTDYEIPLTNFNNPPNPGAFIIQEFSGIDNTIYIDNLGFI